MIAGLAIAVAAVSGPAGIIRIVEGFDLAKVPTREATCADRGASDDIVVCAPKNMEIWLVDKGGFEAKPLRATFTGPLNAETIVHVIQDESPVVRAPAAAVTLKWRF